MTPYQALNSVYNLFLDFYQSFGAQPPTLDNTKLFGDIQDTKLLQQDIPIVTATQSIPTITTAQNLPQATVSQPAADKLASQKGRNLLEFMSVSWSY